MIPSPQGGPPPVIPSPQGGPPPVAPSPQGGPPPVVQIGGNRATGLPHGQSTAPPLNAVSGQSAAPARPGSFVPNFRFNQTQPPAGPTSNLNQSSMGSPTSDSPLLRQDATSPVSNPATPGTGTSGATRSAQPRIRATARSPRRRGGASLELRQRADEAMGNLKNAMESDTSQTQGGTSPLPTGSHETVMDRLARDTLAAKLQPVIAAAQAQYAASPEGRYNQLKHQPLAIEWRKDVPPTATRTTPHGSAVTAQNQTRQVHPGTPAASAVGSRTSGERGTTPSVSSVGQTQNNQSTSKFNMDAPAFVPKSARVTPARQDAAEAIGTQNPTNPGAPPTATQPTGTPDRANKGRGQGEPKQNQRGKNKGQNKGNGRGKGNRQVVPTTGGFTINEAYNSPGKKDK